jgi:hypothetical protein
VIGFISIAGQIDPGLSIKLSPGNSIRQGIVSRASIVTPRVVVKV